MSSKKPIKKSDKVKVTTKIYKAKPAKVKSFVKVESPKMVAKPESKKLVKSVDSIKKEVKSKIKNIKRFNSIVESPAKFVVEVKSATLLDAIKAAFIKAKDYLKKL